MSENHFAPRPLVTFDDDPPEEVVGDPPDGQQVRLRVCWDNEYTRAAGITYQRCGGGRRIIRKKKGGD
mgnify:CR=1 FL=1